MQCCSLDIAELVGETLTHIDVDDDSRSVLLTTASGRQLLIDHQQDCCEEVRLMDMDGNWVDLIGKPILWATEDVDHNGDPEPEIPACWTWTHLTFKVDDATVVSKWLGESNGYYSEEIRLSEVKQ